MQYLSCQNYSGMRSNQFSNVLFKASARWGEQAPIETSKNNQLTCIIDPLPDKASLPSTPVDKIIGDDSIPTSAKEMYMAKDPLIPHEEKPWYIKLKDTFKEKIDNIKNSYNKADVIIKSLGVGLIAGTALSIPTIGCKLIKQGITSTLAQLQSTIAGSSALGGLLATGGTILYLDNKSDAEIKEISDKYTIKNIFKNFPAIGKTSLIGGAIGLIGSAGVCISNFIKNKSFHLPKNAGLLARTLTVAGAAIGLGTGIYRSEWKIEKNA